MSKPQADDSETSIYEGVALIAFNMPRVPGITNVATMLAHHLNKHIDDTLAKYIKYDYYTQDVRFRHARCYLDSSAFVELPNAHDRLDEGYTDLKAAWMEESPESVLIWAPSAARDRCQSCRYIITNEGQLDGRLFGREGAHAKRMYLVNKAAAMVGVNRSFNLWTEYQDTVNIQQSVRQRSIQLAKGRQHHSLLWIIRGQVLHFLR
jgi:hypothetical protein